MTEDEERAVRYLREILREDTTVAETLLGFPWLADGVTKDEAWAVTHLRVILREDPAVEEALLGFPWLPDGVTKTEREMPSITSGRFCGQTLPLRKTCAGIPVAIEADGVTRKEEQDSSQLAGTVCYGPQQFFHPNRKTLVQGRA